MLKIIRTEPTLIAGLIRAILLCVTAFGLHLSAEQIAAVMLVTEAALSVVTRSQVTPTMPKQD
jgi:hypothetical protein